MATQCQGYLEDQCRLLGEQRPLCKCNADPSEHSVA